MSYNLTNLTAANNFLEYSIAVDQLAGGLLFAIFIVVIGLVAYSRIDGTDSQKLVASSFLCFVLSLVLMSVGILSSYFVSAFFIILLFGFISVLLSR